MSRYTPNDLAIVSEYAKEQMLQTVPVTATPLEAEIKIEEDDLSEISQEEKVKMEIVEENVKTEIVEEKIKIEIVEETPIEDAIDAVLAGKTMDVDSSDATLSSDSEDSLSSEEEEEVDVKGSEEEEEEEDNQDPTIIRTAHEIVDIEVQVPNFEITPQTTIVLAGEVFQIVDNVVVVQSRAGSEFTTLDQGSLLAYENRTVMGEVFETFGPIARPFYTVRFKSRQDIDTEVCQKGSPIFYVPDYQKTQFVQTEALKKIKGTDASNQYDEEPDEEELEFSDDEKERAYKSRLNKAKKQRKRNAPSPFVSRDTVHDNESYNNLLNTIPPRQPQTYADMYDDFSASLDAYQQQRQVQSYSDMYSQPEPQVQQYNSYGQGEQRQIQSYSDVIYQTEQRLPPSTKPPVKKSLFGSLPPLEELTKK